MRLIKKKQKKKFTQFFSNKEVQVGAAAALGAVGLFAVQGLVRTIMDLRGDVIPGTDDLTLHEENTIDTPAEEERA